MATVLLALALFVLVVEPLLVAVHEAGHALVPLALGRDTHVVVGGDRGPTVSVGHLTVTVSPSGFLRPVTVGATLSDVHTGRWTLLGGTVGGPLASAGVAVVCWVVFSPALSTLAWWLVFLSFVYSGTQAALTALPIQVGGDGERAGYRSDGRIALELLLGRDPVLDGAEPRPPGEAE